MKCPFLAEAFVKNCQSKELGRPIPSTSRLDQADLCSGPGHHTCPLFQAASPDPRLPADEQAGRCPNLREAPMLYCTAAPVVKFIPYSRTELSRCGNGRHVYCDVFLSVSNGGLLEGQWVDNILVPRHLCFAPNHMWIHPAEDGYWHMGIDGFLATLVGTVQSVTFLTNSGTCQPSVVLSVRGVDLPIAFPWQMELTQAHSSLRATPKRVAREPYGRGWLFEGQSSLPSGLLSGRKATNWMHDEVDRLSRWVHGHLERTNPGVQADGGVFSSDLLDHLDRDGILSLFHEFFLPSGGWEKQ